MEKRKLRGILAVLLVLMLSIAPIFATVTSATTAFSDSDRTISVNLSTSFMIDQKNVLYGFGNNSKGQVGDGTQKNCLKPIKVLDNVKRVYQSEETTYALRKDNTLWAWGKNDYGQVGNGSQKNSLKPIKVLDNVKSVQTGSNNCFAVRNDNTLWAWGKNDGELGNGTQNTALKPVKIAEKVKKLIGTNKFLSENGELWGWGTKDIPEEISGCETPMLIRADQSLITDGSNMYVDLNQVLWVKEPQIGEMTVGDVTYDVDLSLGTNPDETTGYHRLMDNVKNFYTDFGKIYVVRMDNSLWGWGLNDGGQLGLASPTVIKAPVKIMEKVSRLAFGNDVVFALDTSNQLWSWGKSTLLLGTSQNTKGVFQKPVKILDKVKDLEITQLNAIALTLDGGLFTWGLNSGSMALGNGSNDIKAKVFKPVKILDNVDSFYRDDPVFLIPTYSLALKKDGSVWSWGAGESGQLGTGDIKNRSKPVKIFSTARVNATKAP